MSKTISIVLATVFIISVFSAITQGALASTKTTAEGVSPAAAVTVFIEGFEGAWPGPWTLGDSNSLSGADYWGDSNYRSYIGLWSGWCADYGWQQDTGYYNSYVHLYDNNMRGYMYRPVSLGGYASVTLTYYYWISSETNLDYLQVIYYAGGAWYYIDKHTGYSYGWKYSSVSIPTYATYVGFYFLSDYSVKYEGAYIDQVVCTGYTAAPLYFSDGFETGSFSRWSGTSKTSGETATVTSARKYSGIYSARFTSNGGGGSEVAACYKYIPSSTELYARAYFYVSQSGIVQNEDRFHLITFRAAGNNVAFADWRKVAGVIRWSLMIRHGTGPNWPTVYSSTAPLKYRWYRVELHWRMSGTVGMGELFVNGVRVCIITGQNTASFGPVNQVSFGLPGLMYCGPTTVYCDNARIQNTYIGA